MVRPWFALDVTSVGSILNSVCRRASIGDVREAATEDITHRMGLPSGASVISLVIAVCTGVRSFEAGLFTVSR